MPPRKKKDGRVSGKPPAGLDAAGDDKSWRVPGKSVETFHRAKDPAEVIRLGAIINDPDASEKDKKKAAADILKNYGIE